LTVFSVPARYGEAFGLYVIEAWAASVPVVQPRVAAFPELVESTGGGLLCAPEDPDRLAAALEELLLDRERARLMGRSGRQAVDRDFTARRMGERMLEAFGGRPLEPSAPAAALKHG
jgi:glycosyltransferase involved in cell wall biosynthesis